MCATPERVLKGQDVPSHSLPFLLAGVRPAAACPLRPCVSGEHRASAPGLPFRTQGLTPLLLGYSPLVNTCLAQSHLPWATWGYKVQPSPLRGTPRRAVPASVLPRAPAKASEAAFQGRVSGCPAVPRTGLYVELRWRPDL